MSPKNHWILFFVIALFCAAGTFFLPSPARNYMPVVWWIYIAIMVTFRISINFELRKRLLSEPELLKSHKISTYNTINGKRILWYQVIESKTLLQALDKKSGLNIRNMKLLWRLSFAGFFVFAALCIATGLIAMMKF